MNYCFNHILYSLGFVILTISVLQSGIKPVESTALSLRNSIDNQNYCQLQLFQIQSLRGRPDKIFNNKRIRKFRRGKDKSARTIGHCCWKLYQRTKFRGRSIILGGNTKLRNTRRAGFSRRVRSVRKINGCTD